MKVDRVQMYQPSFGSIKIVAKENKHVKFLYNKVLDIVRQEKIPAVFATDYIKFDKLSKEIQEKFTKLGIKYKEVK